VTATSPPSDRQIKIGVMARPHSGVSDFYRELSDLFGCSCRRVVNASWDVPTVFLPLAGPYFSVAP
jgi:hypothetical protein